MNENRTLPAAAINAARSLTNPFNAIKRGRFERVREFDRVTVRLRTEIYDAVQDRRAQDWSVLANQVVGYEDLSRARPA